MTYDNAILTCKSTSPFFELERDGIKPNTIRVVSTDELLALGRCTRIHVIHAESGLEFEREISGIFDVTPAMKASGIRGVYNKLFVCICWDNTGLESDDARAWQEIMRRRSGAEDAT